MLVEGYRYISVKGRMISNNVVSMMNSEDVIMLGEVVDE
jgi:ribosomal protein S28E/S33